MYQIATGSSMPCGCGLSVTSGSLSLDRAIAIARNVLLGICAGLVAVSEQKEVA